MTENVQKLIIDKTKLKLGVNKINEISRLVYEISRREKIPPAGVLRRREVAGILDKKGAGYLAKFSALKKYLIERRYPNAVKEAGFKAYFSGMNTRAGASKIYAEKFYPERILVEREAEKYPLAGKLKGVFPGVKCETIEDLKSFRKKERTTALDPKKRDLLVAVERWDFVKPCPCTRDVVGCGYHVIHLGFGCPYDCSYCFLQQYSNSPGIVVNANIGSYIEALDVYLRKYRDKRIRIGTGEFTDSLALDGITGYSKELVPFFARQNAVLELKTKSANVGNLAGLEHGGNTVVSWSLNPQKLIENEESGTASLRERLEAAKICRSAGYGVGFHFDPVIHYEGWEKDYELVVNDMFDAVPDPVWISLGSLRFHRTLKNVVEARFPESGYIYGELVLGADKKMRYYPSLRKRMYENMSAWIKKRNASAEVYLCMEGADMWRETLGRGSPRFFKDVR